MELVRAFISAAIPDTPAIAEIKEELRKTSAVNVPDKMHLTLRFLGDVPENKIKELSDRLKKLEEHPPFDVLLRGTGAFPNVREPKVVWIGAEPGEPFLQILHEAEKILNDLSIGFDKRKFRAHVTIGRVRRRSDDIAQILDRFRDADAGSFRCSEIYLMGSVLTPEGAKHTVMGTIRFAG